MTDGLKVVLAGGGTGGHVIPAISLAKTLAERGAAVHFVGTRGRLEERLVPAAGFDIDYIDVKPLVGKGIFGVLIGLTSLPLSILTAARVLRRIGPDVVMGVGGYVAGPVVMAASLLRIPTALLEQNATLGLTNRLLSRFVKRAFSAYEDPLSHFSEGVGQLTGNPIKPSIRKAAKKERLLSPNGQIRLLVMGGSQGAKAIDERVPAALKLANVQKKVTVQHQCAAAHLEQVAESYNNAEIDAQVTPFIEDTATAYLNADLVVARSGATTVSELQVMGLPSILLPYPHHKDRQQEKNAEPLRLAGGAVVLDEKTSDVSELASTIQGFVDDNERLVSAGQAARRLGREDASDKIADTLFVLGGRF